MPRSSSHAAALARPVGSWPDASRRRTFALVLRLRGRCRHGASAYPDPGRPSHVQGREGRGRHPAFNAAKTLRMTYAEILDQVVVDRDRAGRRRQPRSDRRDRAILRARPHRRPHDRNLGMARTRRPATREACRRACDIVIMVHGDYQYTPKLIPAMASMIGSGSTGVCRIQDSSAGTRVRNGMPVVEIRRESGAHPDLEPLDAARSCRNTTRVSRVSRGSCCEGAAARCQLRRLRLRQPDARAGALATAAPSRKSVVRRGISRKRRPSTSCAACATASGAWRLPSPSGWRGMGRSFTAPVSAPLTQAVAPSLFPAPVPPVPQSPSRPVALDNSRLLASGYVDMSGQARQPVCCCCCCAANTASRRGRSTSAYGSTLN